MFYSDTKFNKEIPKCITSDAKFIKDLKNLEKLDESEQAKVKIEMSAIINSRVKSKNSLTFILQHNISLLVVLKQTCFLNIRSLGMIVNLVKFLISAKVNRGKSKLLFIIYKNISACLASQKDNIEIIVLCKQWFL